MALRGSYKTGPGMGLSPDSLCDEICRKAVAYADALIVALAGIAARPLTWASGRALARASSGRRQEPRGHSFGRHSRNRIQARLSGSDILALARIMAERAGEFDESAHPALEPRAIVSQRG